jgi:hypothetical protein
MCGNSEILIAENSVAPGEIAVNEMTEAKLEYLNEKLSALPQVEIGTKHNFSGGVYTRSGLIPATTLIIGRKHKAKNIFHLSKGEIIVWDKFHGVRKLIAPFSEVTLPETQRVGYAITDVEGCNIFETEKTKVEEVEAEMLYPVPSKLLEA